MNQTQRLVHTRSVLHYSPILRLTIFRGCPFILEKQGWRRYLLLYLSCLDLKWMALQKLKRIDVKDFQKVPWISMATCGVPVKLTARYCWQGNLFCVPMPCPLSGPCYMKTHVLSNTLRAEESMEFFRREEHSCNPPCACWESNQRPLESSKCSFSLFLIAWSYLFI